MFLLLPSKLILGLLSETYGSLSPYNIALVTATAVDDPAVSFSYDENISFSTSQPIEDMHRGYRFKNQRFDVAIVKYGIDHALYELHDVTHGVHI